MLVHEPASMNMSKWIRLNLFKIFYPCWHNIRRIFPNIHDRIFGDMEEYFVTCPWMNDFYGWKYGLKNGWTLFWTLATNTIFEKNWIKKTGWKQFMLVSFKNNLTQNVQITFQTHISYFLNMKYNSSFTTFKPYKMLN